MLPNNVDVSGKIISIDCQTAGVSGDMFLGTLLDLGANPKKLIAGLKLLEDPKFGYENVEIKIEQTKRKEFKATKVDVTAKTSNKKNGAELIEIVEILSQKTSLSKEAKEFAMKVITTLVNAEASIHGNGLSDAHLHEVGLVDTPAEIIGSAICLDDLGLFGAKIFSTPVAVGGGTLKFSHGLVSNPAPATLSILQQKHFQFKGGPIEAELTTPTGAAILVNFVDEVNRFYPNMVPLKVGYGAGNKDFEEIPNILRMTIGNNPKDTKLRDEIAVLETNIDDVTGEIVGYTTDKLLEEGAKDVSIIPILTKKNRPGQIIKVIADPKDVSNLSKILAKETGTLGVRVYFCMRHLVNREIIAVNVSMGGNSQTVKVKVAKNSDGTILSIKPEFEDLKKIAKITNSSLRELSEITISKAREILLKK
jgi:pyridinium-3,5-bisthiocarboxylic acid mononucleotide nickel chelatase